MIKASIVADSKNEFGKRITTFVVTFPRIVLAEFNTHRMLSRNSASSRAIPYKKMLKSVMENPFIPIKWMKEHSGMQGTEYFSGFKVWLFIKMWLLARTSAVIMSKTLSWMGLTKQICNRLLEPFMWHTVIVTGTEWENFFALRAHEAAEIHIQELAHLMLIEYNNSIPKVLMPGEYHIPFGDKIDVEKLIELGLIENNKELSHNEIVKATNDLSLKIATARCARVSYTVVGEESKPDNYINDIKLHDRLFASGHMSPFEHCAISMTKKEFKSGSYNDDDGEEGTYGWSGNFRGFTQYRKILAGENKKDSRVVQK